MKSEPQIPGREGRFAYSINEVCAATSLGRDAVYRAISAGLAGLPRAGGHEQG
jgi:acetyl-CoA acetyltransferase